MEREEGEGRGRRGGGEMRGKKGIIVGGMILSLLLGCNNGLAELEKENKFLTSISNLGKGFLSVFTDLGDMVTGALGIKADTKKEEIGKYFTAIETTMKKVKERLNTVVGENGNYAKVKEKVNAFIKTIETIEAGAKKAAVGAKGEEKIGGAPTSGGQDAVAAETESVNQLVNGIKEIVGVILDGKGDGTATKTGDTEKRSIGKLFGTKGADGLETQAAAASSSIGSVSGADILRAIAISENASGKPTIATAKNAAEIAAANQEASQEITIDGAKKDAVIAAGIALRAMAKSGKFAAKNAEKDANAVNGAVVSAVSKTLSTLIIAVRNIVDSGLKTISEALAAVKQEDISTEKSEGATTK